MNLAEVLAVLAVFSPIVYKLVDFLKLALNGERTPAVTQLVVWLGGIGIAFLVVHSNFSENSIGDLNAAATILAGLSIGSVGSVINDFKQARDNTDSAVKPPLIMPARRRRVTKTK